MGGAHCNADTFQRQQKWPLAAAVRMLTTECVWMSGGSRHLLLLLVLLLLSHQYKQPAVCRGGTKSDSLQPHKECRHYGAAIKGPLIDLAISQRVSAIHM